jgi:hypothetical protein
MDQIAAWQKNWKHVNPNVELYSLEQGLHISISRPWWIRGVQQDAFVAACQAELKTLAFKRFV